MQFVVHAYDATDEKAFDRRMAVRPDHLSNVEKIRAAGHIICAGGLTDESGRLKGSVLVMEYATRQELDAYLESEPYVTNKVWGEIRVDNCNVLIVNNERVK